MPDTNLAKQPGAGTPDSLHWFVVWLPKVIQFLQLTLYVDWFLFNLIANDMSENMNNRCKSNRVLIESLMEQWPRAAVFFVNFTTVHHSE